MSKKTIRLKIWVDGKLDENLLIDETTYLKISRVLGKDDPY